MGLFKKLDLRSITEGLEKIMEYEYNGNEKDSQYWDYYTDQINEMSIIAADMYSEIMQGIICKLEYQMPWKEIAFCDEDKSSQTAIAWWNTAACMLSDTDMAELLEGEDIYLSDFEREKEKRIKALERLTKKQQMMLYTEVIGFTTRYLELTAAFETITAIIQELDYHQSAMQGKDGDVKLSQSAYL